MIQGQTIRLTIVLTVIMSLVGMLSNVVTTYCNVRMYANFHKFQMCRVESTWPFNSGVSSKLMMTGVTAA